MVVQYMGGTLTEKTKNRRRLMLGNLLINKMFRWLNFDRDM
jgi:hypothetical protein